MALRVVNIEVFHGVTTFVSPKQHDNNLLRLLVSGVRHGASNSV